jgi:hypothetical protein
MAKIDDATLNRMFQFSGVDKASLYASLKSMASELKNERNFSYVASEFVFNYMAPKGSQPYSVKVPGQEQEHFFVRWPNGFLVDLAAEQVPDYSLLDYSLAKKRKFRFPSPSGLARKLAELMEIED